MYAKMKELGPLGGVRRARPLDPPMTQPWNKNHVTKTVSNMYQQTDQLNLPFYPKYPSQVDIYQGLSDWLDWKCLVCLGNLFFQSCVTFLQIKDLPVCVYDCE